MVDDGAAPLNILALHFRVHCWGSSLEFSEHPIYELELSPVLVAIKLWATLLYHSHVVFYSDNNAARSALVRADGATLAARGIVTEFVKFEKLLHWLTWFGRAPSHSNPRQCTMAFSSHTKQVVLQSHLSQWGICTGTPEARHRKT